MNVGRFGPQNQWISIVVVCLLEVQSRTIPIFHLESVEPPIYGAYPHTPYPTHEVLHDLLLRKSAPPSSWGVAEVAPGRKMLQAGHHPVHRDQQPSLDSEVFKYFKCIQLYYHSYHYDIAIRVSIASMIITIVIIIIVLIAIIILIRVIIVIIVIIIIIVVIIMIMAAFSYHYYTQIIYIQHNMYILFDINM